MDFLPIFLKSRNQPVAVIGGGVTAARKVDIFLRSNCDVTVYAKELGEELLRTYQSGQIKYSSEPITVEALQGCIVAIGASKDSAENTRLYELAKSVGVPINIVDNPAQCDFIMPAIVDRSPIVIAVSSSGTTPLLARLLRSRIETAIPAAYGRLAEFAGSYRERVKTMITDSKRRLRFWEVMTDGPIAECILSGKKDEAIELADNMLEQQSADDRHNTKGEVYLVGAGPGDPDLLTFKALRLMQQADVVLYDRLIGDGILDLVRREAERIYVGKIKDEHELPQGDISGLLVKLAKEGKRVLRLKGGDPFIFGRGGEEIETLSDNGIAFQVVPGITASHGCASYAGIPLTHRDHAQTCTFVTGHAKNGEPNLNWKALAQPNQTVVIYMGLSSLGQISRKLVEHGCDSDMPVAVIANGTRPNQKVVTGILSDISSLVEKENLPSPAIVIVGTVVFLRDKLSWYGS